MMRLTSWRTTPDKKLIDCLCRLSGEALQRSGGSGVDDDTLYYVLPPMLLLILIAGVGGAVWFGLIRRQQKKRHGMAMTSSENLELEPF